MYEKKVLQSIRIKRIDGVWYVRELESGVLSYTTPWTNPYGGDFRATNLIDGVAVNIWEEEASFYGGYETGDKGRLWLLEPYKADFSVLTKGLNLEELD